MVKKVKGHRFNVPSVAQGGKDAPGVGGTRGVHRWADPGVVPGILRPAGDGVKAPAQRAAPHVERPDDALGRVGAMVVGHRGPDDHQVSDDDRRGRDTVFPMLFRLVAEAHGQVDRSVRGEVVAWPAGAGVQHRESRADRGHEDAQRARLTRSPARRRPGSRNRRSRRPGRPDPRTSTARHRWRSRARSRCPAAWTRTASPPPRWAWLRSARSVR